MAFEDEITDLKRRLVAAEELLREMAISSTALRESEQRYRTLFGKLGQGFCELKLIRGVDGRVSDLQYIFVNPAHERLAGIKAEDAVGRTTLELVPTFDPSNFALYDEAVNSGSHRRVEYEVPSLGRWYEVYIYPSLNDRVFVFYEDFTDRKRNEQALRESEERQRFLLKLGDALRSLSDPDEVIATASEYLGKHLGLDRCFFGEVDPTAEHITFPGVYCALGVMPFPGQARLQDFGKEFLDFIGAGNTLVVENVATDSRLTDRSHVENLIRAGVAACVGVPLIKRGGLTAILSAHQAQPRSWTASDITLLEDVAERTWAVLERARAEAALRESEEHLRRFGEASQDVLWIRDAKTLQWTYLTPAFETIYGLSRDEAVTGNNYRSWMDLIVPEDRERVTDNVRRVRSGEHAIFDYRIKRPADGQIRWLRNTDFPIRDEGGSVTLIGGIGHDLTELREAELRLETLVGGIPQLVWRAVDDGHWSWASPQWQAYTGLSAGQSMGRGWLDALHSDDRNRAREAWAHAEERGGFEVEYRLCHAAKQVYRWFQTRATPVRDEIGGIIEWLGTSTDVQELKELQEHQGVLVAELQHRTRNLMGVVRYTAEKTLRRSADLADFKARYSDRLAALARVQGLLSRLDEGQRITFDELLRVELAALNDSATKASLSGPNGVALRSSTVQTFALALHELATNALKYGAFAQPQGRLEIRWRLERAEKDGRPWLHLDWRESGVAMPAENAPPRGGGSGRDLIERALPYQLGAKTTFVMEADGVHCTIAVPVSERQAAGEMADA